MATTHKPSSPEAVETVHATIMAALGGLRGGTAWGSLLDVAAQHPGIDAHNVLILWRRRPKATDVRSFDKWQEAGYTVTKGQRGVAFVHVDHHSPTGYRVERVFDVSQTTADQTRPPKAPGTAELFSTVAALSAANGTPVVLRPGLIADSRIHHGTLEIAADTTTSPARTGHVLAVLEQLARQATRRHSPEELAATETASILRIVAGRVGLTPPQHEFPDPQAWAAARWRNHPESVLGDSLGRILTLADQLSTAITAALGRHLPQPSATAAHTTPDQRQAGQTVTPTGTANDPAQPQPTTQPEPAPVQPTAQPEPARAAAATDAPEPVAVGELYAVNAAAAAYFAQRLAGVGAGRAIRYLREHGIFETSGPNGIWGAGYAPKGGALLQHLHSKGFPDRVILAAGLAKERDGEISDKFINRVVLPVHDTSGRVIGFTGRTLSSLAEGEGGPPKWMNTANNALYQKGSVLFGFGPQPARHRADATRLQVVIGEGAADAIALVDIYAGLAEQDVATLGFAPCGTALSAEQLTALAEHVGTIANHAPVDLTVVFDGDNAGRKALAKHYDMLKTWPHGQVRAVVLPGGQDPAELLSAQGPVKALSIVRTAEQPLAVARAIYAVDNVATAHPDRKARFGSAIQDEFDAVDATVPFLTDTVPGGAAAVLAHIAARVDQPLGEVITSASPFLLDPARGVSRPEAVRILADALQSLPGHEIGAALASMAQLWSLQLSNEDTLRITTDILGAMQPVAQAPSPAAAVPEPDRPARNAPPPPSPASQVRKAAFPRPLQRTSLHSPVPPTGQQGQLRMQPRPSTAHR